MSADAKGTTPVIRPSLGQRPMRRLCHLKAMDRGGVETLLIHMQRSIDRNQFQRDLVLESPQPTQYDDQRRALDSKVIACATPQQPWRHASILRQILGEHATYDIVRIYRRHYSGSVLWSAKREGVPVRRKLTGAPLVSGQL